MRTPPLLTLSLVVFSITFSDTTPSAAAADIDECRQLMLHGDYAECLAATTAAVADGIYGESWHLLKAEAELRLGKYPQALETLQTALQRYSHSIRLRWKAIEACRFSGQPELEQPYIEEIANQVQATPWRYTDVENLVMLAEFALENGADAKEVQQAFLKRAQRNNPLHRSPNLALGNLALQKRDFQLAADIFRDALESHANDPDMLFGLSQALAGSDAGESQKLLLQTLEQNPRHIDALLRQAERLIDGEKYEQAQLKLADVIDINPLHPDALALMSVISLLLGNTERAEDQRDKALSTWPSNPVVDHIIGRKLSQKYRFAQGAQYQQAALKLDPDYLPAQKQLAQDLLRLGQEDEGWRLADSAFQKDQYDVAMYNLITLRDALEQFDTIESNGFVVRMDHHEAQVYGQRVIALLTDAREQLCVKYELDLPETVLVEIFPDPADFAVRTFGMPGVSGYLGVCFGDVITTNSPASQLDNPSNWEAVLWHEFTHVVTLNKTHNRMPRWLSEGISVYEERQRHPTWGEQMSPVYARMILDGELTPIGDLSNAFLSPESPMHLQFAYFESSLVVEYIINNYGFSTLLSILEDLGVGIAINETLERHTAPLPQLEEEFEAFVRYQLFAYGAGIDWSEADLSEIIDRPDAAAALSQWAKEHPRHYSGLKQCAQYLLRSENEDAARIVLEQMIDLLPESGRGSPYPQLAEIYRRAGEAHNEYRLLKQYAAMADAASGTYQRLIEIEMERENWEAAREHALQLMAVNPLSALPHATLARVAEINSQPQVAVPALQSLLELEPHNLADLHFRLAEQLKILGRHEESKRHILQALEEAPRFREALRLLLELKNEELKIQMR